MEYAPPGQAKTLPLRVNSWNYYSLTASLIFVCRFAADLCTVVAAGQGRINFGHNGWEAHL
ncbi:MAG: hypothetical protein GY696_39760 [Gammaproteobacteria bacterium]|nr:hypothetical protein [Gammaproteobacteria bacterium]